jgi:hypothetical protein
MIMMWPCKVCKNLSTSPEGCLVHRPERPQQTFEDELYHALTASLSHPEGGVVVSGMTFPPLDVEEES